MQQSVKTEDPQKNLGKDLGVITRVAVDLVAGTLVGAFLGYVADRMADTSPWLMIAGVFLGAIAGFRNTFRYLGSLDK